MRPSFPFDEVVDDFVGLLASSSVDRAGSRVQDFFNFVIFIVINQVEWWWRRGFLIRECRRDIWGQELLVEAWVNLPVRRELQLVSGGSSLVKDHEWSNVLVVELLLWSWEMEIGGVQPDLVADAVIVGGLLLLVVLHFHVVGGILEGIAGLFVNLRHCRGEFCCCRVCEW